MFVARRSCLTGSLFIGYYRKARAGLHRIWSQVQL